MSKREVSMFAAQGVDVDAPRAKRHKGPTAAPSSPAKDVSTSPNGAVPKVEGGDGETVKEDGAVVKEKGLKLWHLVKDAVNKEGRSLAYDFLRLPSKRQYPDYYQAIKHPVALDEIKHQLDKGSFATFEDVTHEFETCFRNAKRYNVRDSQIWKDAKHLHKLVQKESAKLSGVPKPDGEDGAGSDGDGEGTKKKKTPNMSRLLKSRLQKLIEKTDDSGRVRSTEFMELPSKKTWPIYYKQIKKPQCLENIFKRLKRKEYHTALDFANDVELVFANALEFNQEHTPIWEDAVVLRDTFRLLMADLPSPYTIPAYSSNDHPTKIKLKVPAAHPATPATHNPQASSGSPPGQTSNSTGGLMLRIPALRASTPTQPPKSPVLAPTPTPAPSKSPMIPLRPTPAPPTPKPKTPSLPPQTPTPTPATIPVVAPVVAPPNQPPIMQPSMFAQPQYAAFYANTTAYTPARVPVPVTAPTPTPIIPAPTPPTPVQTMPQRPQVQTSMPPPPPSSGTSRPATASGPPTPVVVPDTRPLRAVTLTTQPRGRRLDLSYRDGVKTWAVRLAHFETSVHIEGIKFQVRIEDEDSSDEDGDVQMKDDTGAGMREEEEEAEESTTTITTAPTLTTTTEVVVVNDKLANQEPENEKQEKPKRGRGRPRKHPIQPVKTPLTTSPKPNKGKEVVRKPSTPLGDPEVLVKLNGVVKIRKDGKEEWDVDLHVGSNVLEVGEKGGCIWRVYLERLAG